MTWLYLSLTLIFWIFVTALYVGAEFSTVSSRKPRLLQLAAEGNQAAGTLAKIVEDPKLLDEYVATCQVGITVSSLVLGFYGQGTLADSLTPIFIKVSWLSEGAASSISTTIVLILLTFSQALIGELVPKNIGLQYPEKLAIISSLPMQWSIWAFKPLIWLLNGSGTLILRLMGIKHTGEHNHIHAPEEILMLVEESGEGGVLDQEERRLLKNTLEMRDAMVRQVMVPRTRMLFASDHLNCGELFSLLADSPFSRIPLYRGTIDNIVGAVHIKDLLCLGPQSTEQNVQAVMNSVPFVPETTPVKVVFAMLQKKHLQMAIVLDEFGGTAGMVTIEDLLEEIFGELGDEFDSYVPPMRLIGNNRIWIRGDWLVEDLNQQLELQLPVEEVDTIGGLVLNAIGRIPSLGEQIEIEGQLFKVEKMRGRGIGAVSMSATPELIKLLREIKE